MIPVARLTRRALPVQGKIPLHLELCQQEQEKSVCSSDVLAHAAIVQVGAAIGHGG
jgi:hypothetical protein